MRRLWRGRCACVCLLAGLFGLAAAAWARETVRVGVYENSPKIGSAKDGKPEGIFVDVIETIAAQEGWKLEYVHGTWGEGLDRLVAGSIDLMPDVAETSEREKLYDFHHEAVISSWFQVYTRKGGGLRSLPDLAGKRILVLERSVQMEAFQHIAGQFGFSVQLIGVPDYSDMFKRLAAGEADAAITNRYFGLMHAESYGLEDTAIVFEPSNLYFAARKNIDRRLLDAIDRQLKALKSDPHSAYFRSLERWTAKPVEWTLPLWIKIALAVGIAALAGSITGSINLKQQVNARTASLARRNEEMQIVNRTLGVTGSRLEMSAILEEVIRSAIALSGCDGGVLCVQGKAVGELRVGASINAVAVTNCAADGGAQCEATCPAALETASNGDRYVLAAAADSRVAPPCGNVRDASVCWNVYFPMRAHGNVVGLLCLFSRQARSPEAHGLQMVQDLCVPVALAMENARLYEETRQHAAKLEASVAERTRDLGETTHFLDALIDHISSPIFYKGADLRFRGCNRAYEEAFGISRSAFIGKTVLDLEYLPVVDRLAYQAEDAATVASAGVIAREAAIPFADGKLHQTLYSVAGFRNLDGTAGGLVGVIVDVTQLKETEAALREAKHQAEAADRIKSAFLATMSHELRTPLNSIIGFTGLILQELPGPLNAEQKKQLGMVRNSAQHLLALINDVLDISKIEAGELKVAIEPLNLGASIDKVCGIVAPLAERRGLRLDVEGRELAGAIMGDARRVEQILFNLLSNAIKFTEAGRVTLKAARMRDSVSENKSPASELVRITVADTGGGIKPEDMRSLFQPFRQIDSRLSRNHEGTGLGLAISRKLAEMMGGRIEAESRWGVGSEFHLILPLAEAPGQTGEPTWP